MSKEVTFGNHQIDLHTHYFLLYISYCYLTIHTFIHIGDNLLLLIGDKEKILEIFSNLEQVWC
jgi:hypothetical protein